MRKVNLNELYKTYISAAKLYGEATKAGDYKTVNKQFTIINRLFKKVQKNIVLAEDFYLRLMENEDASVKIWACADSLALKINVNKAESILLSLSQNKNLGILRLDAEMTLKQWKEKGYLKS